MFTLKKHLFPLVFCFCWKGRPLSNEQRQRLETLRHDRDMAADPSATHHRIGEAKRTDEGVGSTTFGGSLSLLEIFFMGCHFFLELEKV